MKFLFLIGAATLQSVASSSKYKPYTVDGYAPLRRIDAYNPFTAHAGEKRTREEILYDQHTSDRHQKPAKKYGVRHDPSN